MSRTLSPAVAAAGLIASLTAAACLGFTAPAAAQDPTLTPYFRSLSFFGVDDDGDGTYSSAAPGGIDYRDSNSGPASTFVTGAGNVNGATVSGTASSRYNGFFSARNSASLTINNVQANGYYIVGGQGSHTRVQFFTPGALAERSVFTWRVTGTGTTNAGMATGRLDFLAGAYDAGTSFDTLFDAGNGALSVYGPGTYTYTLPLLLDQPIDLFYWSSAFVEVSQSTAASLLGGVISGSADFGNTFTLEKIDLYDANDNLITEWTMQDLSTGLIVFDQNGRTFAAGAAVPEPGTLTLALIGGLGLAAFHCRARRRAAA